MEAEVQIIFPTRPTAYSTTPVYSQYRLWDVKTGIYLIPIRDDHTAATLLVSEGGRNHSFILVYKRDISNYDAKLYYDYSTIDKLAMHIRQKPYTKPGVPVNISSNVEPLKYDTNKKEFETIGPVDSSLSYYALLEEGDKELKLQHYNDATATFTKAHNLRPEDYFPVQRLEDVKDKLAEDKKSGQAQVDKRYVSITADAKNAFNQKKYAQAVEAYKQALELKPGDVYATQQLKIITNLLLKETAQKAPEKKAEIINTTPPKDEITISKKQIQEDNYTAAMKSADNFFKAASYDSAKIMYNKALGFIKRDEPRNGINAINKILSDQAAQAKEDKKKALEEAKEAKKKALEEAKITSALKSNQDSVLPAGDIKKNYNLAIANAKLAYSKNDLVNAKIFYEEAITLQPSQQQPKNQLKIVNDKLEAIAVADEIDSNYDRTIDLADSQVNSKNFEASVTTYKQASVIKPLEQYPKNQLKYVQSEIAAIEKRNREEREKRYSDALIAADKAVADKKYEDAKSAYTEALSIHPENDYAKKRLDIVNYQLQLERERLAKLSQDTLKPVEPVKKSKRKK